MPYCWPRRLPRTALASGVMRTLLSALLGLASNAALAAAELPRRAQLGVQMEPAPNGVKVQGVSPGLSAAQIGLRQGDVIVALDGQTVAQVHDAVAWVGSKVGGDAARVAVLREGQRVELQGRMVERPREASPHYRVEYGEVASERGRLRTLVTVPPRSGRHPALLFIQGVTLGTVDFALTADNGYAQIVGAFARAGFVTMRVDKPGVGDSEGGPGATVDFQQELDGYRQALKALFARPDVDPRRVLVFGHSMGGLWGPVLAAEFKQLRGLAVAGTGFRTWLEYTLENTRRQSLLAGAKPDEVHADVQQLAPVMTAFLHERLTPAQIAARWPQLKTTVEETFEGDTYGGRGLAFWHQVSDLNLPEAWNKVDADVLVLWGANDFLVNGLDHDMLAAHLNARRPGSAKLVRLPRSDHAFLDTSSQADSFASWGKPGKKFNRNVIAALSQWVQPLAGRGL
jgi:uncharacterized protein